MNKYRGTCIHTVCNGEGGGEDIGSLRQINTCTGKIFKKSRHLGFGVFIDIWSMGHTHTETRGNAHGGLVDRVTNELYFSTGKQ